MELETVRHREMEDAALVATLWYVISIAIGAAGDFDVVLPVLSSLVIFAGVEAFRLWRGIPLSGSNYWRITTLAFWTVVGYATFVASVWYLLPISLAFLGLVLFENERARRPSAANVKPIRASTTGVIRNADGSQVTAELQAR